MYVAKVYFSITDLLVIDLSSETRADHGSVTVYTVRNPYKL
jgi:hypothetical protein